MQIDWITVSAQIVNFLVLVYLLQHFLYKPIVRAMDKREQRIADRLNEAEQREIEATEQIDTYREKTERLERERQSMIDRYRHEASEEKQELLEKARREVDEVRHHWQSQAAREKGEFLAELRRQAAQTVTGIARKVLADLSDSELEERVIEVFIHRLENIDEGAIDILPAASGKLHISTAFELDRRGRGRIERTLSDCLGKELKVEFHVLPELVCGVRLGDDGHALDWNLVDYMEQLVEDMDIAVEAGIRQA